MPTVRDDVAFGPANLGLRGDELRRRASTRRSARWAWPSSPIGRRTTSASASAAGWRWPPCWPCSRTILVLDEPSSNLDPAARREFADIVQALAITTLMVTHDLPYALELCPRSVIMNEGSHRGRRPHPRDPRSTTS